MPEMIFIWSVFKNPIDHPGMYVARKFLLVNGRSYPTDKKIFGLTLEHVRRELPVGLTRNPRHPSDPDTVVENWS